MAESWLTALLFSIADILSTLLCIMVLKWLPWPYAFITIGLMLIPFHVWSESLLPYYEEAITTFQICLTIDLFLFLVCIAYFEFIGPESIPAITLKYFIFMFFIAIIKLILKICKLIYAWIVRLRDGTTTTNKSLEPADEVSKSKDKNIPSTSKKNI